MCSTSPRLNAELNATAGVADLSGSTRGVGAAWRFVSSAEPAVSADLSPRDNDLGITLCFDVCSKGDCFSGTGAYALGLRLRSRENLLDVLSPIVEEVSKGPPELYDRRLSRCKSSLMSGLFDYQAV